MSNARNLARLLPDSSGKVAKANSFLPLISTRQAVFKDKIYVSGNTGGAFVNTGVYISVTPASASSIFEVTFVVPVGCSSSANGSTRVARSIGGGSYEMPPTSTPTALGSRMQGHTLSLWQQGTNWSSNINNSISFIDNPNTTSPVTYQFQVAGNQAMTYFLGYNYDVSNTSSEYAVAPMIAIIKEYDGSVVSSVTGS